MKKLLCLLLILISLPAFAAPTDYDSRQDDRFTNYVIADAKLSGVVETELGNIKWVLVTIAGAIIVGVIGLGFAIVKKKIGVGIFIVMVGASLFLASVPLQDAECQGGCEQYSCRVDSNCPESCYCDSFYFQCRSKW
jgi:hypothetical protein